MRIIEVDSKTEKGEEILKGLTKYGFVGMDRRKGKNHRFLYTSTLNSTGMVPNESDLNVVYSIDKSQLSCIQA